MLTPRPGFHGRGCTAGSDSNDDPSPACWEAWFRSRPGCRVHGPRPNLTLRWTQAVPLKEETIRRKRPVQEGQSRLRRGGLRLRVLTSHPRHDALDKRRCFLEGQFEAAAVSDDAKRLAHRVEQDLARAAGGQMGFERLPDVWGEIVIQVVTDLRLDVLTCKSCHDEYPQLRHDMGCEFLTQHEPSAVGASLDRAHAQAKCLRHLRDRQPLDLLEGQHDSIRERDLL